MSDELILGLATILSPMLTAFAIYLIRRQENHITYLKTRNDRMEKLLMKCLGENIPSTEEPIHTVNTIKN